ncbi:chaplin [Streptomyces massasporeus]|uniref:chaplin n=1 Tax=Streptomyces massasporeus TaxID=67324 RepID=UPI00167AA6D9|nr:chaplin [Streptomyces massasporeus]GGV84880.1 small membrane protein [Streptomyces massasporeus]
MHIRVTAAAGLACAALLAFAGTASANDGPVGVATNSPGVLSGNVVQIPIDINANVCGNSINVIGLFNPAFGKCEIKD